MENALVLFFHKRPSHPPTSYTARRKLVRGGRLHRCPHHPHPTDLRTAMLHNVQNVPGRPPAFL